MSAGPRIWFTARMHGFEAVSSWVAEGLVRRAALSQETEACWLRENADLFVAPLVDVDSVERGGTGKYRCPPGPDAFGQAMSGTAYLYLHAAETGQALPERDNWK